MTFLARSFLSFCIPLPQRLMLGQVVDKLLRLFHLYDMLQEDLARLKSKGSSKQADKSPSCGNWEKVMKAIEGAQQGTADRFKRCCGKPPITALPDRGAAVEHVFAEKK